MSRHKKPHVLIVDDEPDTQTPLKLALAGSVSIEVLHPTDLELSDLLRADLILVDHVLDHWPERNQVKLTALKPANGLALAAVLRAHVESEEKASPTAFAILSGHLARLSGGLQENSKARANNLEWAFSKERSRRNTNLIQQTVSLATAVRQLPRRWPQDDPQGTWGIVAKLLGLPKKARWKHRALKDIEDCHPPIHELAEQSHGLVFLRWVLQRIVPYPCFLWDIHYVAARFRVTTRSLERVLSGSRNLRDALRKYQYVGILHDFLGTRWWRAGIETFLWDLTDGNSAEPDTVRLKLRDVARTDLEPTESHQPLVCIGSDYKPLEDFYEVDRAVRVQPEDWPAFADQAWTAVDLAKENPSLRALVISLDREKLKQGSDGG